MIAIEQVLFEALTQVGMPMDSHHIGEVIRADVNPPSVPIEKPGVDIAGTGQEAIPDVGVGPELWSGDCAYDCARSGAALHRTNAHRIRAVLSKAGRRGRGRSCHIVSPDVSTTDRSCRHSVTFRQSHRDVHRSTKRRGNAPAPG